MYYFKFLSDNMSKKRFYYNTWYHPNTNEVMEYEIIDSETLMKDKGYHSWCIYLGPNDSNWQDMLVDKLNALYEENQQLKKEVEWWKYRCGEDIEKRTAYDNFWEQKKAKGRKDGVI